MPVEAVCNDLPRQASNQPNQDSLLQICCRSKAFSGAHSIATAYAGVKRLPRPLGAQGSVPLLVLLVCLYLQRQAVAGCRHKAAVHSFKPLHASQSRFQSSCASCCLIDRYKSTQGCRAHRQEVSISQPCQYRRQVAANDAHIQPRDASRSPLVTESCKTLCQLRQCARLQCSKLRCTQPPLRCGHLRLSSHRLNPDLLVSCLPPICCCCCLVNLIP